MNKLYQDILNQLSKTSKLDSKEITQLIKLIHESVNKLSEKEAKELLATHLSHEIIKNFILPVRKLKTP